MQSGKVIEPEIAAHEMAHATATNTGGKCQEESCFLSAEAGWPHCILHSRREGKSHASLAVALEQHTARDVKQIKYAYLRNADLTGLYITLKNFQYSDLTGANFSDARLFRVGFDFSTLDDVNFENVIFDRVDLRRVVSAKRIGWHNVIFASVEMPKIEQIDYQRIYDDSTRESQEKAVDVYRNLKETYRAQGHYEAASWLNEQEMDLRRRLATTVEDKVWLTALWLLCGYGERPGRSFLSFFVAIVGFAILFTFFPLQGRDGIIRGDFLQALYFSVVTFTSLGFGDIAPLGFSRVLVGSETLIGIFLISLFIYVFCRKMIR